MSVYIIGGHVTSISTSTNAICETYNDQKNVRVNLQWELAFIFADVTNGDYLWMWHL